jgi:ATP-dependent Clp protease ATP-binding subunit ClpA
MATKFPFHNEIALRIANLITKDIDALCVDIGAKKVNWQTAFQPPYKANYANWIVQTYPNALSNIETKLPKYEANANKYRNNPSQRGRPLTEYVMGTSDDNKPQKHSDAIVIDDAVPVPSFDGAKVATLPEPRSERAITNDEPLEDDEEALRRELEEVLRKHRKAGPMDEDRVREIADEQAGLAVTKSQAKTKEYIQQALEKMGALPTRIELVSKDADGKDVVRDFGLQHKQFATLMKLCGLRDHNGFVFPVWLPGPAGSGKTTAAMHVAKAMEMPFHANGAIDTEYKLLGFTDAGGKFHETPFYKAYKNGGVYLFDEVDASNPQALVAMNAALENGFCTFGNGEKVARHADCIVIAAANTFGAGATAEYVGRNKLDAATVDRFIMLAWEYDEALERALCGNDKWCDTMQAIRKVMPDIAKHVVSPRASIRGAAMLADGFEEAYVLQAVVYKGLSADAVRQVNSRRGIY